MVGRQSPNNKCLGDPDLRCRPAGLLSVASASFLVSITQRQQVAQIQGRPVYAVANVALIPTTSQADATRAIAQARKEGSQNDLAFDSESEDEIPDNGTDGVATEIGSAPASPTRETFHARGASVSSIAEDVLAKRVRFGRFAANWLSRKTLGLPQPGALEQSAPEPPFDDASAQERSTPTPEGEPATPVVPQGAKASGVGPEKSGSDQATELLPKLLHYTKLLFASRNFFFAYDYDLTRSYDAQEIFRGQLPLHKIVDSLVCFE